MKSSSTFLYSSIPQFTPDQNIDFELRAWLSLLRLPGAGHWRKFSSMFPSFSEKAWQKGRKILHENGFLHYFPRRDHHGIDSIVTFQPSTKEYASRILASATAKWIEPSPKEAPEYIISSQQWQHFINAGSWEVGIQLGACWLALLERDQSKIITKEELGLIWRYSRSSTDRYIQLLIKLGRITRLKRNSYRIKHEGIPFLKPTKRKGKAHQEKEHLIGAEAHHRVGQGTIYEHKPLIPTREIFALSSRESSATLNTTFPKVHRYTRNNPAIQNVMFNPEHPVAKLCAKLAVDFKDYGEDIAANFLVKLYRKLARGTYVEWELELLARKLSDEFKRGHVITVLLNTAVWKNLVNVVAEASKLDSMDAQINEDSALSGTSDDIKLGMTHSRPYVDGRADDNIDGLVDRCMSYRFAVGACVHMYLSGRRVMLANFISQCRDLVINEAASEGGHWEFIELLKDCTKEVFGIPFEEFNAAREAKLAALRAEVEETPRLQQLLRLAGVEPIETTVCYQDRSV